MTAGTVAGSPADAAGVGSLMPRGVATAPRTGPLLLVVVVVILLLGGRLKALFAVETVGRTAVSPPRLQVAKFGPCLALHVMPRLSD